MPAGTLLVNSPTGAEVVNAGGTLTFMVRSRPCIGGSNLTIPTIQFLRS